MNEDERFARKVYITFKARANAESRLRRVGSQWGYALTATSTAVLIGTIFALAAPAFLGTYTAPLLASTSAVVVIQSMVVSQSNFASRADRMLDHYRRLQSISDRLEAMLAASPPSSVDGLRSEYQRELESIENHSALDYRVAELGIKLSNIDRDTRADLGEKCAETDLFAEKSARAAALQRSLRRAERRETLLALTPWVLPGLIAIASAAFAIAP